MLIHIQIDPDGFAALAVLAVFVVCLLFCIGLAVEAIETVLEGRFP